MLLDENYNPKVADYGFSRFVKFGLVAGGAAKVIPSETYCGTPSHLSPQLLLQVPYDPFKVDVWTLGMILFIMLNQIYPFDKRSIKVQLRQQMNREYRLEKRILVSQSRTITLVRKIQSY